MAVHFTTAQPKQLLADFDSRISQAEQKGKITTWERIVFEDAPYYTHTASQWNRKAYFKPAIENGQLTFYIIKAQDQNVTTVVYGYYHGHLTETFLNHFDQNFSRAGSTALPIAGDTVSQ